MPIENPKLIGHPLSVLPPAEELAQYAALNSQLPLEMLRVRERQLRREFIYAALSLGIGFLSLLAIVGGYIYLVMNGHPATSAILLGAGVLSLVGGIIRSRLKS